MTDKRFSSSAILLLKSIIGMRLKCIRCDPFTFNNMTYKVVSLFIDDAVFLIRNEIKSQDYFSAQEDICNLDFVSATESDARSELYGVKQIDIPFNTRIVQIYILNETQCMYSNGILTDEYSFVRGLVFILDDDREISFEKTDDFSEEIAIQRGHNLIERFSPIDVCDSLEQGLTMHINRNVQMIK